MISWDDLRPWVADAMVIIGMLVVSAGVIGMLRLPDPYSKIHAVGKAVFFGVVLIVLSTTLAGEREIALRALLIALLLLLTTPVSTHLIGRAVINSDLGDANRSTERRAAYYATVNNFDPPLTQEEANR